jgi:sugar lactone lactonase YvrE
MSCLGPRFCTLRTICLPFSWKRLLQTSLFFCATAVPVAWSQAPIATVILPGSTAVGQQSATATVSVTISQAGTVSAPTVVTQGITNLDFQMVSGGNCGGTYGVGQQCTVNVVFAPKYPGQRSGAVVLESTTGIVLGQTLLSANATGGLSVLVPGEINTIAGDGAWIYNGDGALATQTPIFLPQGVVEDAAGNLYLSGSNNDRIRRVDAVTGVITTVAGDGNPGYSGDGGPATQAMINTPAGIMIDGAGDIYFADTGNHAIRRIEATTQIITTVAGTPTVQGYHGDGGSATTATLSLPEGIVFDTAGDLYIADTGNDAVREVNAVTGIITTVAGTGIAGYMGDGGAATAARLNSPWSLAIAADGSLYIADLTNNVVRRVNNGIITTVVGNGTMGFGGDGAAPAAAELNAPASIVFDPAGDLYIADSANNRIRKVYASTQTIQTIAGNASEQLFGDGGPANLASLYGPYGLFVDQGGNLFIADMFHNRIREINATTDAFTYDTMRVGKLSVPQAQGVENDGNAGVTLTAPTLNNSALDPATTTCNTGLTLPVGRMCNLGIDFAPTTVGDPVLGSLLVNSNAGNSPDTINLSGEVLSVEPTSVSLTTSVNPALEGSQVIFTAKVSSASTSLNGTIVFLDGSTQICSATITATGAATCSTSTLTLGQHSITASYSGDADDAASVSSPLTETIQQAATVTLTATPNPAVVTSSVTLVATVTATTGTPTGTVTFYDGTTPIGSAPLTAGVATFATSQLTAATHQLSAQYGGDLTDAKATSNTISQVIHLAATSTTIATSSAMTNVGTAITLSASVTSANGPTPTGTVQFIAGGTVLATGTLAAGAAPATSNTSVVLTSLPAGSYNIVATYSGDADNATSNSTALLETVQQIPTTSTLTSDANPAQAGATIHLTATVAVAPSATADGAISGTVTFSDGSAPLGTAAVNASGQATLAVSSLNAGNHQLTASYGGSTIYASSSSSALAEQVLATATTTTISTSAQTVLAGEPVTWTIAVTSSTGTPTGVVVIESGGTNIGQVTLNAQGTASLTLSSLTPGPHTLTAIYQGTTNYTGSTSTPLQETISLATTTVTLSGPGAPVDAGTLVALSSTLSTNGVTPTGTISLRDNGAVVSTQTVNSQTMSAGGTFNFSTSSLGLGSNILTVSYSGDDDNAPAISPSITVIVQQAPTTTTLATSANPSTLGQTLTLTAGVTSPGAAITGSIVFEDGTSILGSVPLTNGSATLVTSALTFGAHTLTAVYSGDTNHAPSNSIPLIQQIVEPATATLSSSDNPSVAGANVVLTARIAGMNGLVPTGNVAFNDGATLLATAPLDATGTAVFQTAALLVGSHPITITYAGDKNYSSATAALIQTVQNASTQVTLTASANPATYGTAVTFTAAITSNGVIATGPVSFTDGSVTIGSSVLNASGTATFIISTLAPGSHSIVAHYAGNGQASASVSTPVTVVVQQVTEVALTSNANPSPTLSAVTFTASVTNSGVGIPTGVVTFTDGATSLGAVTLSASGQAALTVPQLSAGTHAIIANYAGDATNFAGTSSSLAEVVQLRSTTTTLSSSATGAANPQQVTLIGVVRGSGPASPTGTVSFMAGGKVIGSSAIDATGVATLTIDLESSTETITAVYSGDTAFATSSSTATAITVSQATQFNISVTPSSVTVASKQHIVVSLVMNSVSGFTDTMDLGCLGLPYAATCTFSNPQMSLPANGTATVQLTIDTGDPLGVGSEAKNRGSQSSSVLLCMLPFGLMAGLLSFRRRRSFLSLALVFCAFATTVALGGCGGLQSSGTPPGTYSFKVSAVGAGTGAAQAQTMTLTVTQ